ncbi:MAG: hypothetical protein H0W88_09420 [Parachlamydiaceae bacterium]|nr:hypothetical protein [Parachlamydiaceae bacterium]
MLSKLKSLIFFLLCFLHISSIHSKDTLLFSLDDKKWKIGYQASTKDFTIFELIPKDESINDWDELYTIQSFDELNATEQEFVNSLEKVSTESSTLSSGKKNIFKLIEGDPSYIVENFFVIDSSKENVKPELNEYNIGRIIKGKDVLYYVRYTTHSKELFDQNKEKWIQRLKNISSIALTSEETQKGKEFSLLNGQIYEGSNKLEYLQEMTPINDEKGGFSMTLPSDWMINKVEIPKEKSATGKESIETIPIIFFKNDQSIYGGIAYFNNKAPNQDLDYVQDAFSEAYKKESPQVKFVSKNDVITKADDKGKFLIFEDGDELGVISFFQKNEKTYRVETWTKKDKYENAKSLLEEIQKSFHITD